MTVLLPYFMTGLGNLRPVGEMRQHLKWAASENVLPTSQQNITPKRNSMMSMYLDS